MNNKTMFALAFGLLLTAPAAAQDEGKGSLKSYNFVEAQGGIQFTPTDANTGKLITPMASLSLGRFFAPAVGARLHVSGWEAKSGFEFADGNSYYKWNYITTDLDLLLNLNKLFSKKNHAVNVMLLGGIGLNTAWGNDEAQSLAAAANAPSNGINMPFVWDGTRLSHNIRAGLRLETDVTKPVGVSLEVTANSLDDRFNSKCNNSDDWMITAQLGVSFRFGHKYKQAPKKEEPAPEVKSFGHAGDGNLHIYNCSNDMDQEEFERQVADFMKRNPQAKVRITGYADKGTGNARVNKEYSEKRAQEFKDELVKSYGADASRIIVDAKGDTVQPFTENDKNRCVIIIGPVE